MLLTVLLSLITLFYNVAIIFFTLSEFLIISRHLTIDCAILNRSLMNWIKPFLYFTDLLKTTMIALNIHV